MMTRFVPGLLFILLESTALAATAESYPCVINRTAVAQETVLIDIQRYVKGHVLSATYLLEAQSWVVVVVETDNSDELYLFFHNNDQVTRTLAAQWSGAATRDEARNIAHWLTDEKGVPAKIARCFAWYVTEGRYKPAGPEK